MEPLASRYDHNGEDKIYELWEKSGCFAPEGCVKEGLADKNAEPFSIVLPPPNVTGTLHMGHAEMLAIEDIMVRYHRMKGDRTLWVPGTDHAAIATQSKVEKELQKKEGKSRYDLGREEFLRRVDAFAKESHDTIATQMRKMGASVDWGREAFTLDEKRNLAVRTAFERMYDAGLIYRGYRVVNWDPKGQTTISDDEIVYEERKAKLYTFRYDKNFPIPISTTRPETKFGDTAVAVHPDDERYKKYVGQTIGANFLGEVLDIKIIADNSVDMTFGTGALGVTPAHSMADYELWTRHKLLLKQVINEYGKMMVGPEGILDKKTAEARGATVELLRTAGLIEKEEEVPQNISTAERTGGIVEPLPKLQWFVAVNKEFVLENSKIEGIPSGAKTTLKEIMRKAVQSGSFDNAQDGQIKILPERFTNVYYHWIDNLRDWCISRQIWYGHRIPVWYKHVKHDSLLTQTQLADPGDVYIGIEPPSGDGWEQDPDTLDTWFSSGLWTFSTLGWPTFAETATAGKPGPENDLANFHPTSVLETAPDILFFWVARMILMSGFLLGDVPFRTVYLHSIVLNKEGKKMSKSSGHAIDPLDMVKDYGADAARLSLIVGATAGGYIRLSEDKIRGYRNFSTKIWNAARFVLMSRKEEPAAKPARSEDDRKNLGELALVKAQVAAHIESFDFHLAAELAYHYFWHTFADKIVETAKPRLQGGDAEDASAAYGTLRTILLESLTMLHPFVPFVTESVYQEMKKQGALPENSPAMLMIRPWQSDESGII